MRLEMFAYLSHDCLVQTHSIAVLRNIGLDDRPVLVSSCTAPIALRTSSSSATADRHVVQRRIEFSSNQSCVDLFNVVAVDVSSSRVFFSLCRVHR